MQAVTTTFAVVLSIALFTEAVVVIAWAILSWRTQTNLLRVVRDQCDRVAHMRYQGFTVVPTGDRAPLQPEYGEPEEIAQRHREMEARHANAGRDIDHNFPPEVTG